MQGPMAANILDVLVPIDREQFLLAPGTEISFQTGEINFDESIFGSDFAGEIKDKFPGLNVNKIDAYSLRNNESSKNGKNNSVKNLFSFS